MGKLACQHLSTGMLRISCVCFCRGFSFPKVQMSVSCCGGAIPVRTSDWGGGQVITPNRFVGCLFCKNWARLLWLKAYEGLKDRSNCCMMNYFSERESFQKNFHGNGGLHACMMLQLM